MKKDTQWMLIVTALLTFALACICADQAVEMEDYEFEVRSQDGGNTNKGYYVVAPKPLLPLVIGSKESYTVKDWEDESGSFLPDIDIIIDEGLGNTSSFSPTKEGIYTVTVKGKAFQENNDYQVVEDTIDVRVVEPKRVVIDGLCASKVLATDTSQFVSVRFAYDDQKDALAYGKGYYPLNFDASVVKIPLDDPKTLRYLHTAHTMRTMNVIVSKDAPEQITLYDQLDNERPIVFTTTTSKTIKSGTLVSLPEYKTKTNNPDKQRLLLQATLDDDSMVCPEDFEVKSLTPDICEVLSDVDYILDRRLPAGDAGRWSKDNYRWYLRGLKQGVCKVQAIVEGFEGAITQTFTIDAPPIRTVEIRQRVKDKPSSGSGGSGGGSGFDYD